MTTNNRFEAVKQAVRAGDDQARRDAEQARARRRRHLCRWWYGEPTREARRIVADGRGSHVELCVSVDGFLPGTPASLYKWLNLEVQP